MTLYLCLACFFVPAIFAVRATLQRSEARGEAAIATARANKAEQELAGARAEATAHRERAERESAARELAVSEAAELRKQLAAAAVPGAVRADLQSKFGG